MSDFASNPVLGSSARSVGRGDGNVTSSSTDGCLVEVSGWRSCVGVASGLGVTSEVGVTSGVGVNSGVGVASGVGVTSGVYTTCSLGSTSEVVNSATRASPANCETT